MKKIIIYVALSLLCSIIINGQNTYNEDIKEVENNLLPMNIFENEKTFNLEERMQFYQVPGLSITVIKDYQILWTKCYGYADIKEKNQ